ncbi:hypothetical protein L6164_008259 [Bauhinia variegata]|uniref:Uncharacterized protein n=1 Tax=Bauhinia variegata TaxID=167791 RepID=A0ACB9PIZ6_BAUVA|nr:hypothetical protein L6164_008259 [Bauhinia variegata]
MCLALLTRIMWNHCSYVLMPWTFLCMQIFFVKTMKRVLFAEVMIQANTTMSCSLLFWLSSTSHGSAISQSIDYIYRLH